MEVFTVTKPGGAGDREFEAYTRLLEDVGLDVTNVIRVPEPDTHRRWLYAWERKGEAEGFARELKTRTRDGSWRVARFEIAEEDRGPVAPLDVYQVLLSGDQEVMYYLTPASRERIIRAYPGTRLNPSVTLPLSRSNQSVTDPIEWWDRVAGLFGELRKDQIISIGGYRVIFPYDEIGYEESPGIPAQV